MTKANQTKTVATKIVAEQDEQAKTIEKSKSEARAAAASKIRRRHQDEYNEILVWEMNERGIDWTPRLNAKQKAAKKIAELIAEYPDLEVPQQAVVGTQYKEHVVDFPAQPGVDNLTGDPANG